MVLYFMLFYFMLLYLIVLYCSMFRSRDIQLGNQIDNEDDDNDRHFSSFTLF